MTDGDFIPPEILVRNPLITRKGLALLNKLKESPHAPRWNHSAGDRLAVEDLAALQEFEEELAAGPAQNGLSIPEHMITWLERKRTAVPAFRARLPEPSGISEFWTDVPTMSREDVATSPELFVPDDADLESLIVYRTAGTTGHSLLVPHSPRAAAMYQPMLMQALKLHGVNLTFTTEDVACFSVCAQARTVTYPTVLSAWNQAGFAKINLNLSEWRTDKSPQEYFEEFNPLFLTGDPISFAEMLRLEIKAQPAALVSTAVAMSASLKTKLEASYGCPVIEWYSLTETGPIGYGCPAGNGYHLLPHDIYIECLDPTGIPVRPGERGEITVTGGRNPYLPLLRYRTGDWGQLQFGNCSCGSTAPRLETLEGRKPVNFRSETGSIVNPVDISGVLRDFSLVQHEFIQHKDLSIDLCMRPIPGMAIDAEEVARRLKILFGSSMLLSIRIDDKLGDRLSGGKALPYQSELLED